MSLKNWESHGLTVAFAVFVDTREELWCLMHFLSHPMASGFVLSLWCCDNSLALQELLSCSITQTKVLPWLIKFSRWSRKQFQILWVEELYSLSLYLALPLIKASPLQTKQIMHVFSLSLSTLVEPLSLVLYAHYTYTSLLKTIMAHISTPFSQVEDWASSSVLSVSSETFNGLIVSGFRRNVALIWIAGSESFIIPFL